jgi:ribosomal protein S18 acetylase RimI-like enzyme
LKRSSQVFFCLYKIKKALKKEVEITAFQESDRDTLAKLYTEVRLQTFTWLEKERILSGSFNEDTEGELILVAKVNQEIAGFVAIWEPGSFIHHLYVLPAFQRLGVGQQLLKSAVSRCSSAVSLKCLTANVRAVDFYIKNGWAETKRGGSWDGDYILFEHPAPASGH